MVGTGGPRLSRVDVLLEAWERAAQLSKLLWIVAIANTAGAVVLAAVRYSSPSAEFWVGRGGWVLTAVVVTLAVPLTQAAVIEMGERGKRKALERERSVQTFLISSLLYVVREAGCDVANTGIQAFVVRGWGPWRRQERLAKIRLGAIPSSGIRWQKGKGVIGRCWETRSPQYHDLAAHFAQLNVAEARWDSRSETERFGLTFKDFSIVKDKYGIVAAVPIVKQDQYVGCLTADMPPLAAGASAPNRERILNSLATTAGLVAEVL